MPGLARLVYVSTGGVYGNQTPASSASPQSEDGPFAPHTLYAMTKFAGELLVRRYAELFGFDQRTVRLSGVFGPLERPTTSRTGMSAVHSLVHAAVAGRPLRLTARTLESAGDHVAAEDVADGIARLAGRGCPPHDTYNLASGTLLSFRDLLDRATEAGPRARVGGGRGRARPSSTSIPRSSARAGTPTTSRAHARISAGSRDRSPCSSRRYADWLRSGAEA